MLPLNRFLNALAKLLHEVEIDGILALFVVFELGVKLAKPVILAIEHLSLHLEPIERLLTLL